jgi:hypothetical protein
VLLRLEIACYSAPSRLALDAHCSPKKTQFITFRGIYKKSGGYQTKWEEYWKKEDPFKERVEDHYHRRCEMPSPFNHWDIQKRWQQYYSKMEPASSTMHKAAPAVADSGIITGFMVTCLPS